MSLAPVPVAGSAFARAQAAVFAQRAPSLPGAHLAWVANARAEALARFAAGDLPDARDEAWRYTSLRALASRAVRAVATPAADVAIDDAAWTALGGDGARLVFVDGLLRADLSDTRAIDRDRLDVRSLADAMRHGADGLCHFLTESFASPAGAFANLNAALHADGAVIRVADGARITTPLHLVFVGATDATDAAVHVRTIVKLGAGASLRLVEHHVGPGTAITNVVTQIALAERAALAHVRMQEQAGGATLIARTDASLAAGADYRLTLVDLGALLARHDLAITLAGAGATTRVDGAAIVDGRRHADLQLRVAHGARDTTSRVAFRGIADDRARSVLGGAIVVREGADGSDAALSNRNLLLSPHAEIDAKPELEIDADEVKAAHGATVGQLDETALFYLRSRGLPLEEARALLTFAFVREMLEAIDDAGLRDALAARVVARLPRMAATGSP